MKNRAVASDLCFVELSFVAHANRKWPPHMLCQRRDAAILLHNGRYFRSSIDLPDVMPRAQSQDSRKLKSMVLCYLFAKARPQIFRIKKLSGEFISFRRGDSKDQ